MGITVKEQHRLGSRVNIAVLDGQGAVTYARYVDVSDWDADADAVAATLADYLSRGAIATAFPRAAVNKNSVTLTDAQIATKLAAIAAGKLAAGKVTP